MATTTKSLSALPVAKCFAVRTQTARMFIHNVCESIKSSESQPLSGSVHVDDIVLGGKVSGHLVRGYGGKNKKAVCSVELTDMGKVKRF
jgi:hypothetical protein